MREKRLRRKIRHLRIKEKASDTKERL